MIRKLRGKLTRAEDISLDKGLHDYGNGCLHVMIHDYGNEDDDEDASLGKGLHVMIHDYDNEDDDGDV